MKKILFIWIILIGISAGAQTTIEIQEYQDKLFNEESVDSYLEQEYEKNQEYSKKRAFESDLKEKYKGQDFQYNDIEEIQYQEREVNFEQESTPVSSGFNLFGSSLPFIILIVLAVLVIFAVLQRSEFGYFRVKRYKTSEAEILDSDEDESIDEGDFERLSKRAAQNGNFRLATRYYYLWLLQKLSQKNYIEYHKDKTNSEYQFELEDQKLRAGFSYLSYVYSYIWYGEFPIDQTKFATIEEKYKSFMKNIK